MTRNCQKEWLENAALHHLESHLCISTDPGLIRHFIALGTYFLLRVTCSEVLTAALQLVSLLNCCMPWLLCCSISFEIGMCQAPHIQNVCNCGTSEYTDWSSAFDESSPTYFDRIYTVNFPDIIGKKLHYLSPSSNTSTPPVIISPWSGSHLQSQEAIYSPRDN